MRNLQKIRICHSADLILNELLRGGLLDDVSSLPLFSNGRFLPGPEGEAMMRASRSYCLDLLTSVRGTALLDVEIIIVSPGEKVALGSEHSDQTGDTPMFVAVIDVAPGASLVSSDEAVPIATGEVWWVNWMRPSFVINNSKEDTVLIKSLLRV